MLTEREQDKLDAALNGRLRPHAAAFGEALANARRLAGSPAMLAALGDLEHQAAGWQLAAGEAGYELGRKVERRLKDTVEHGLSACRVHIV